VYVHRRHIGKVAVRRLTTVYLGHARLSLLLGVDVDLQPAYTLSLEH
jgi:hypothetical protein